MLSRESIHKVKATNNIFHFGIYFIENTPITIVAEFIGKNGRFVALVTLFPLLPIMVKVAKGGNTQLSAEGIVPPFFHFFFTMRFNDDIVSMIPHSVIVFGIPFHRRKISVKVLYIFAHL